VSGFDVGHRVASSARDRDHVIKGWCERSRRNCGSIYVFTTEMTTPIVTLEHTRSIDGLSLHRTLTGTPDSTLRPVVARA
jgi:hypothetical protein